MPSVQRFAVQKHGDRLLNIFGRAGLRYSETPPDIPKQTVANPVHALTKHTRTSKSGYSKCLPGTRQYRNQKKIPQILGPKAKKPWDKLPLTDG
jgi:hypothetical protein